MPLAIIQMVRNALETGEPLKASDVRALCAVTDQLWQQIVDRKQAHATGQHRRDYMREYMRRYRANKRTLADATASDAGPH